MIWKIVSYILGFFILLYVNGVIQVASAEQSYPTTPYPDCPECDYEASPTPEATSSTAPAVYESPYPDTTPSYEEMGYQEASYEETHEVTPYPDASPGYSDTYEVSATYSDCPDCGYQASPTPEATASVEASPYASPYPEATPSYEEEFEISPYPDSSPSYVENEYEYPEPTPEPSYEAQPLASPVPEASPSPTEVFYVESPSEDDSYEDAGEPVEPWRERCGEPPEVNISAKIRLHARYRIEGLQADSERMESQGKWAVLFVKSYVSKNPATASGTAAYRLRYDCLANGSWQFSAFEEIGDYTVYLPEPKAIKQVDYDDSGVLTESYETYILEQINDYKFSIVEDIVTSNIHGSYWSGSSERTQEKETRTQKERTFSRSFLGIGDKAEVEITVHRTARDLISPQKFYSQFELKEQYIPILGYNADSGYFYAGETVSRYTEAETIHRESYPRLERRTESKYEERGRKAGFLMARPNSKIVHITETDIETDKLEFESVDASCEPKVNSRDSISLSAQLERFINQDQIASLEFHSLASERDTLLTMQWQPLSAEPESITLDRKRMSPPNAGEQDEAQRRIGLAYAELAEACYLDASDFFPWN